jgi:threonine dehydrogenase-like Zn-dependent dehydrogenase
LVLEAPRSLVMREFPFPVVGDDDALVRVMACGLCGTDHEQYTVAAAKKAGAGFVMVTGLGPRDAGRLALAARFGTDLAVDIATEDPVAALARATGGLADVVVDVTAKAPTAFPQANALARPAGTVVVAGTRGFGGGAPGFTSRRSSSRNCALSARWASMSPPTAPR